MSTSAELLRIIGAKTALKNAINAKNDADHQIASQLIDQYASYVGDIYIKDLSPSGTVIETTTLDNGVYHGKRKTTATNNTDAVEFYLFKQGVYTAYIIKNKAGSYRNYVNSAGQVNPNNANYVFNADFAIYKIRVLTWEV